MSGPGTILPEHVKREHWVLVFKLSTEFKTMRVESIDCGPSEARVFVSRSHCHWSNLVAPPRPDRPAILGDHEAQTWSRVEFYSPVQWVH